MNLNHGQHYIQGKWLQGRGKPLAAINPATQDVIWQGHEATPDETSLAVTAAHAARDDWANRSLQDRLQFLKAFQSQIESNRECLAQTISINNGKPLWESYTEVNAVSGKINIAARAYEERCQTQTQIQEASHSLRRFKPHGVVAVLGAFNFPAHLANGHIVPALLAGNTVVYKPSELTPQVAQLIMHCFENAGFPAGVINCVQGGAATAQHLLSDDIQALYFTGSYNTGQKIHAFFADKPHILLALEMGGNNPLIVEETTEIDAAVHITLQSSLITTGQRCTAARRVFVPDNHFGRLFIEKLSSAFQQVQIGAYTSTPEPFMGPVINGREALRHIASQEKLISLGGISILTMQQREQNSSFLSPGLIDMTQVHSPPDEEIFGPFLQIYRYHNFQDAIAGANQTRFGLAAGLIGENADHFELFYRKIRAGLINWNKPTTGASSLLPFGGVGLSGNHRPSGYFAADYCAYPVASLIAERPKI